MAAAPPERQSPPSDQPHDMVMPTGDPSTVGGVPAIRISGLSKIFAAENRRGTISALCDIDLEIPTGQHVAIVGNSGSGKTTLLGCLSGRLRPSHGQIEVVGPIATVHQDLRLVKQRTALDNVLDGSLCRLPLQRTCFGYPRAERKRAADLLGRVGLADRTAWRVSRLSGGEQQRVAIARAMMQDPKILLADEPVASLDRGNAQDIMGLLGQLQRERRLTLVSVLHDDALAQVYADRIISLRNGHLIYDSNAPHQAPYADSDDSATDTSHNSEISCPRPTSKHVIRKTRAAAWAAVILGTIALYTLAILTMDIGPRQFEGVGQNLARFFSDLVPTSMTEVQSIPWGDLLVALIQTLGMSLVGTTAGVLIAWPLAALGARNIGPPLLRPVVRFMLNVIRTVPSLIWALLFVAAVGLGPIAGILALIAYSVGYVTKFFYESFEAVDQGPPSALREIGASGLQTFLLSVWPASKPAVLSSCFYMFEYNVRAASVLGLVGAGGIGYWFSLFFKWRNFPAASACLLLLLVVVLFLDAISTRIRARMVAQED